LDTGVFLGLATGGVFAFALAALFFIGAALGFLGGALTVFNLARLGTFERPATGFHLAAREFVQHHAAAIGLRRRAPRLLHDRRGLLRL
ncbi:hypothetical protein, partial [Proteus mirabilis]|uniref:hypothetical protein n=1 Tax=Proteus mirabilis TaxID=584 RepID=UPI001952DBDA